MIFLLNVDKYGMSFFFRNIKKFFFLFCAAFAVVVIGLQTAKYYRKYKAVKTNDEIAFINTDGRSVVKKSYRNKASIIADNGAPLYNGDSIITFSKTTTVEIPSLGQKLQILPDSEVIITYNNKFFEIFLERGDITFADHSSAKEKSPKKIFIYKKNKENNEYSEYETMSNLSQDGSKLIVTKVQQKYSNGKPEFSVQWRASDAKEDYWVEIWAGSSKESLKFVKAHPFEKGSLTEVLHASQFYWQLRLSKQQETIEETRVGFWKNTFQEQLIPIFPSDNSVLNTVIEVAAVDLKWKKTPDIKSGKVEVAADEQFINKIQSFSFTNESSANFKPTNYGRFFWRIVSEDGSISSSVQSFYIAPVVSTTEPLLSWNDLCDAKQFYYEQPVLFLKWNSNYDFPINRYKVSFLYYQKPLASNVDLVRQENIFVDSNELFFKVNASSLIRVNIQAYNGKMEPVGESLSQVFELTPKSPKSLLALYEHEKTPKNEFLSDRNYSFNFDPKSVSSLYKYKYKVLDSVGESVLAGAFVKGEKINLRGLKVGYYTIKIDFDLAYNDSYTVSQYWSGDLRRLASTVPLQQTFKVKLIPSLDYNIDRNSVNADGKITGESIKPEVSDVEVK